jgi:hypothetical protein
VKVSRQHSAQAVNLQTVCATRPQLRVAGAAPRKLEAATVTVTATCQWSLHQLQMSGVGTVADSEQLVVICESVRTSMITVMAYNLFLLHYAAVVVVLQH